MITPTRVRLQAVTNRIASTDRWRRNKRINNAQNTLVLTKEATLHCGGDRRLDRGCSVILGVHGVDDDGSASHTFAVVRVDLALSPDLVSGWTDEIDDEDDSWSYLTICAIV